ncbi:S-adenosylmethionine:tRNA ribosyltransferase-isomerase [soil metagenome]
MELNLFNYNYPLPEEKIAKFPIKNREEAKLLIYKNKEISHTYFKSIGDHLPQNSLLIFNETKVIPARIFFSKSSGAIIEIFLLKPINPVPIHLAMTENHSCTWSCLVGNKKKWKNNEILIKEIDINNSTILISVQLNDLKNPEVNFTWDDKRITFSQILEAMGEVPLPPYLRRKATLEDKPRYQTVYGRNEGAVAAPTAGLHFTETLLKELKNKDYKFDFLTLHVSAGTFQPIKDENILQHPMHAETIIIKKKNIESLLEHGRTVIAVGTTSMRTLESLYWYGIKLLENLESSFFVEKLYPYQNNTLSLPSKKEALEVVLNYMERQNLEQITGITEIFIFPGYQFKICRGLITNFHLPQSTLILLVASFVGTKWKEIYQSALENNYRFLSYGDSSFLFPEENE